MQQAEWIENPGFPKISHVHSSKLQKYIYRQAESERNWGKELCWNITKRNKLSSNRLKEGKDQKQQNTKKKSNKMWQLSDITLFLNQSYYMKDAHTTSRDAQIECFFLTHTVYLFIYLCLRLNAELRAPCECTLPLCCTPTY